MRLSSAFFLTFALLAIASLVANLTLSPSRGEAFFICMNLGGFGVIAVWSIFAAWQMLSRRRQSVGYALAGFLTFSIVIGRLQHGSFLLGEPEPYPGYSTLRTIGGLFVGLLWVCLIRSTLLNRSAKDSVENRQAPQKTLSAKSSASPVSRPRIYRFLAGLLCLWIGIAGAIGSISDHWHVANPAKELGSVVGQSIAEIGCVLLAGWLLTTSGVVKHWKGSHRRNRDKV